MDRSKVGRWASTLLFAAVIAGPSSLGSQETALEAELEAIETLRSQGDHQTALEQVRRALDLQPPATARLALLRHQHQLLRALRRYSEAQAAGQLWQDSAHELGDLEQRVQAERETAMAYAAQAKHRRALSLLEPALESASRLGDQQLQATLLVDIARQHADLALFPTAEEALDRAEIFAAGAEDPELSVRLQSARAVLLTYRGDFLKALEARKRALELAREHDSPSLSTAHQNLAQVQRYLHDYAGALESLQRARELDPEPSIVRLADIGICHFELNQLDQAEAIFEQARQLAIKEGNARLEAWTIGELGIVAQKRGDFTGAAEGFDRAIDLSQQAGDRRNETVWWMNKGALLRDQARWKEALQHYRRAKERAEAIPGLRLIPNLFKHMGQCHAGLGDDQQALALFEHALAGALEDRDSKVVWETQRELARLHRRAKRSSAATQAYGGALDAIESMRSGLRLESFKTDFFENKVQVYEEYVDFLVSEQRFGESPETGVRAAFAVAERARARGFLDSLAEARAGLEETLPEEIRRNEQDLLDRISTLQGAMRRGEAEAEAGDQLSELEGKVEALALSVRSEYPRFGGLRSLQPADLAKVQAALRPREALLEYFLGESTSHLWIVEANRLEHVTLPARGKIDEMVRTAYTELLDPGSQPESLGTLARLLLDPLQERLEQGALDSLAIVPSGALFFLPFEVLPRSDSNQPRLDSVDTAYLPSAATLLELRARPTVAISPRLLALGDPSYGGRQSRERSASMVRLADLGRLPHTRREVLRLRSLFGRKASTILLEDQASEERLKALPLSRFSVLHFASHAWVDSESPARSALVLAPDPNSPEDGLLQPREILRLDLAADLVTLSACQSALGNLATGEGLVGLARFFFYAGTDSVVASLWNVNDRASADFMALFYGFLADGESKGEALQHARRALRALPEYGHPYFWAPYVLLGRGDDGIELPAGSGPGWRLLAMLLAALAILGVLAALGRRRLWRQVD